MQFDSELPIDMSHDRQFVAAERMPIEFLCQFSKQGFHRTLTLFHLATRELPPSWEVESLDGTALKKDPTLPVNDCNGDKQRSHSSLSSANPASFLAYLLRSASTHSSFNHP